MTAPGLRIRRHTAGTTAQLLLDGELDMTTADELRAAAEAIAGVQVRHLVVDLRGLRYLDSTGLHVLDAIDGAARALGRRVTFVRAAPRLQRYVSAVGLGDRLDFVDDPEQLSLPADPGLL